MNPRPSDYGSDELTELLHPALTLPCHMQARGRSEPHQGTSADASKASDASFAASSAPVPAHDLVSSRDVVGSLLLQLCRGGYQADESIGTVHRVFDFPMPIDIPPGYVPPQMDCTRYHKPKAPEGTLPEQYIRAIQRCGFEVQYMVKRLKLTNDGIDDVKVNEVYFYLKWGDLHHLITYMYPAEEPPHIAIVNQMQTIERMTHHLGIHDYVLDYLELDASGADEANSAPAA